MNLKWCRAWQVMHGTQDDSLCSLHAPMLAILTEPGISLPSSLFNAGTCIAQT